MFKLCITLNPNGQNFHITTLQPSTCKCFHLLSRPFICIYFNHCLNPSKSILHAYALSEQQAATTSDGPLKVLSKFNNLRTHAVAILMWGHWRTLPKWHKYSTELIRGYDADPDNNMFCVPLYTVWLVSYSDDMLCCVKCRWAKVASGACCRRCEHRYIYITL